MSQDTKTLVDDTLSAIDEDGRTMNNSDSSVVDSGISRGL